ncbi:uncharacterized protein LOC125787031 [Astyanax mexicanus]|uniref:uncharacterized protein LOC125787031 n=1 Tax=Astyanax mexicanus TaxID=7994 RepID=UPI0020CB4A9F|nr:uncharacterized protein LOC125787031 [Astyanax mexicanus]
MMQLLQASTRHPVDNVATEFGDLPCGSVLTYQSLNLPTTSITDDHPLFPLPPQTCNYTTALNENESNYYCGMTVTLSDAELLEKETRDQSTNKTWHSVRSQRLTSSVFKRIVSRIADFECLATNMQRQKKTVQTLAMKRGLQMEPIAAAEYEQLTGNRTLPCGFIINPHAPHLGASPDRKVVDNSGLLQGLLEIKCPNVDTFVECSYLSARPDDTFALKCNHDYYYQVMGQMGITGMKWCDFFVHCTNDNHLERIHFDAKKWESMKTKLDMFFFEYFLPGLCR